MKKFEELKRLFELHFKCDCLACSVYKEGKECKEQSNCEVAKTYVKIMKLLEKEEAVFVGRKEDDTYTDN